MTFAITQTGSFNQIIANIRGASYTGAWTFTGDSNTVDLSCDSTSGTNCENITMNITASGSSNAFTFDIGDTADADGSTIGFTVTGSNNVINSNVDGKSAVIAVTVNNSSSLASGGASNTAGTLTSTGSGNVVDFNIDGDGDSAGHSVTLNVTGGGSSYDVTQSGVYDNTIDADFSGDGQDVDIIQRD